MSQTRQTANPEEWVSEDVIDTNCRVEELFLTLVHGTLIRLGDRSHERVNSKAANAFRRLYKKHGRIFQLGPNTPALEKETIEALIWADAKLPPLEAESGGVVN